MKAILQIFVNAKDHDSSALVGYTHRELMSSLVEWFEVWEARPNVLDNEVIANAGLLLGSAAFGSLDEVALEWMDSRYSLIRLEVVAGFLCGYWRTVGTVDPSVVGRFLVRVSTSPIESWAHAASVYAIFRLINGSAVVSNDLREKVYQLLRFERDQLKQTKLHPGILAFIEKV